MRQPPLQQNPIHLRYLRIYNFNWMCAHIYHCVPLKFTFKFLTHEMKMYGSQKSKSDFMPTISMAWWVFFSPVYNIITIKLELTVLISAWCCEIFYVWFKWYKGNKYLKRPHPLKTRSDNIRWVYVFIDCHSIFTTL